MSHQAHSHEHVSQDETSSRKLERAATWLSLVCAVHCLAVPVFTGLMPLMGASIGVHEGSSSDLLLALFVTLTAGAGAAWGYRRHRDARVTAAMVVGLGVYLLGHFAFEGAAVGRSLGIAGALLLAAASFLSARLSQSCDDPSHAHHSQDAA